jgi:hypothetical protein
MGFEITGRQCVGACCSSLLAPRVFSRDARARGTEEGGDDEVMICEMHQRFKI